ncbi:MAG TPA: glycosyltransferase [Blastocatellia bacterium]|nr:glycosyltransferase [Blastocatellia bacterium]
MQAADVITAKSAASLSEVLLARPKPRVLHLITKLDIGGTERQAVELLKRLDPERYDVRLAVIHRGGPFFDEIAGRFPHVPEFPLTSFYNRNAIRQIARLRDLMIDERIDILHAHDFYAGIIGAVAARLASVRVVAAQRHLKLSDRRVHQWGTYLIHRLAHRILVNSEAIRESITASGNARREKIVVIRNGLTAVEQTTGEDLYPAHTRSDELRRELALNPRAKLVGMVARLQPVKGHRFFLEAAARVSKEMPEVHFVLVGDGPLRNEIEERAIELGISDRIHLLGDRSDASRLVSSFDLAVLSSLHEGLPNAVMEAMAAGVPVVATAVGGTKELITDGETGYLVEPSDADGLGERICFALRNRERSAEVAERGREFVMSRYGIKRMVASVEELYDSLLMESKPRIGAEVRR